MTNAKNTMPAVEAGGDGTVKEKERGLKRIAVMLDVANYYELLHAKNKYPVRLSFNQFIRIALPRCAYCGSLIIQTMYFLECTSCGKRYKLQEL